MSDKEIIPLINRDRTLVDLFKNAPFEELSSLADIITDNGKGRTLLKDANKIKILNYQQQARLSEIAELLASEIRAFGSNTIANIFRREPVSYFEIVKDVAKRLGVKGISKDAKVYDVERVILITILKKANSDKSADDIELMLKSDLKPRSNSKEYINRRDPAVSDALKGVSTFSLAKLVSTALTPTVLPVGLVSRTPNMLNPIGLAITAAWTTYDLSGPAFRVTIPAIAKISFIRQFLIALYIE